MATVNKKVLETAGKMLEGLLIENQQKIDEAYTKAEGKIHIGLGLDIEPGKTAEFQIGATLDFVTDRVKDKSVIMADERQGRLF